MKNINLEKQIRQKYPPYWFDKFYGFECGKGWFQTIDELLANFYEIVRDEPTFRILQIKEKFGDLRVYFSSKDFLNELNAAERNARAKVAEICDICGDKGYLRTDNWYAVRCDLHA